MAAKTSTKSGKKATKFVPKGKAATPNAGNGNGVHAFLVKVFSQEKGELPEKAAEALAANANVSVETAKDKVETFLSTMKDKKLAGGYTLKVGKGEYAGRQLLIAPVAAKAPKVVAKSSKDGKGERKPKISKAVAGESGGRLKQPRLIAKLLAEKPQTVDSLTAAVAKAYPELGEATARKNVRWHLSCTRWKDRLDGKLTKREGKGGEILYGIQ